MPWIRFDLSTGRNVEQKRKTAEAITKAMVEHCGCAAESVSMVFNDVDGDNWASGSCLLSGRAPA